MDRFRHLISTLRIRSSGNDTRNTGSNICGISDWFFTSLVQVLGGEHANRVNREIHSEELEAIGSHLGKAKVDDEDVRRFLDQA
jgi:hypothetical protein